MRLKSWLYGKYVEHCFEAVYGTMHKVFSDRDKVILAMSQHEKQAIYFNCLQAVEGGVVKAEVDALVQELYLSAFLEDISYSERTSKRVALLYLAKVMKRLESLALRAKPASSDKPLNVQMR